MKLSRHIHKMVQQFFIVFASIIIILTFLRQIYDPDLSFDLKSIYTIMGFSLLSVVVGFILNATHPVSERKLLIRIAIHFIALETILITVGLWFGLVEDASGVFILALQIAVIYAIVRLLSWCYDKKVAEQINEQLKSLKNR